MGENRKKERVERPKKRKKKTQRGRKEGITEKKNKNKNKTKKQREKQGKTGGKKPSAATNTAAAWNHHHRWPSLTTEASPGKPSTPFAFVSSLAMQDVHGARLCR
jgi:superoxide dismutase